MPARVIVPEEVMGPPLVVRPVVPPLKATEVTVPEPAIVAQTNALPLHCSNELITVGAVMNPVAPAPVWYGICVAVPPARFVAVVALVAEVALVAAVALATGVEPIVATTCAAVAAVNAELPLP